MNQEPQTKIDEKSTLKERKNRQLQIILESLEKQPTKTLSSRKIKDYAEEHYSDEWLHLSNYWDANLSSLAREKGAKFGRFEGTYDYKIIEINLPETLQEENIDPISETSDIPNTSDIEPSPEKKEQRRQEREKNLYSSLVDWLISQEYLARDTSILKKGGKWGNPDITGIKIINDIFGFERFEICTIEAKASTTDWRQYIFEAVSHKRFANRTYFAFATPSESPSINEITDYYEMREYGEKYKIGIIAIFLQPDDFKNLNTKNDLSLGDIEIIEVWPALYEEVTPQASNKFCREVLKLQDRSGVYNFNSPG